MIGAKYQANTLKRGDQKHKNSRWEKGAGNPKKKITGAARTNVKSRYLNSSGTRGTAPSQNEASMVRERLVGRKRVNHRSTRPGKRRKGENFGRLGEGRRN